MPATRRNVLAAVAAFGLGAAVCQGAAAAPEIGKPAPTFTGTTSNGTTVSLAGFAGRTVVLEWTNHGCPYVQKHYGTGNMQTLQKEAAADGVVWITVISSAPGKQGHVDAAKANTLTEERDAAPTHVVLDPAGEIARAYEARTTPHMYVVDPDGTLVYMGGIDDRPTANWASVEDATNHVRTALDALATGKPVDPAVTRPYGCTVKYGS